MQLHNLSQNIKSNNPQSLTFEQRAERAHHPLAKKLFLLMAKKQTNLIVAADITTKKELLELADAVGPDICAFKTHIDIIADFDWDLVEQLQKLAKKHNFLIIEDRKFCDIGSTVRAQYAGGIYKIMQWADIVIAHAISGPGVIKGIQQAAVGKERALFLLTHLSCAGNLIDAHYTQEAAQLAQQYKDFVIGTISQERCVFDSGFLQCTPGVQLQRGGDNLGQQYNTPEDVIQNKGTDIIIVGRGIYKAENAKAAAREYRTAAWNSYKYSFGF